MKHNWKNFLTNTDIIPTDKPLFPLRFLFVFALIASGIFYRFVYIYLYSTPLSTILYDYKISRTSQIYIEGFFITAWIIFITVALFRISEILYDKIIAPLFKFIYFILIELLFILDKFMIIQILSFIRMVDELLFYSNRLLIPIRITQLAL